MTTTLLIVGSGLVAALIMGLCAYAAQFLGLRRPAMIAAVGSLFTRNEQRALEVGWLVHLAAGSVFATLYAYLWSYFPLNGMVSFLSLGAITGFLHGLVISIMLVIEVAEHHPNPLYRETGFAIALGYIATHVVYGMVLAYLFFLLESNGQLMSKVASFRAESLTVF